MKLQETRLWPLMAVALCISACSTYMTPDERDKSADMLALQAGMQKTVLKTPTFPLLSYYRFSQSSSGAPILDVYIEGDGRAYAERQKPSWDPTPINPDGLKMAAHSPEDNVAYVARPCQYIEAENEAVCNTSDWTNKRFSEKAVIAVNAAIEALKVKSGAAKIRLTGFSGGGAIAALVAARRDDVQLLVTVAGNLEPVYWINLHHYSALKGSLNPADFADELAHIPQIHFVGAEDDNIPPSVAEAYRARFSRQENIRIVIVPDFTHVCCWTEKLRPLLEPYLQMESDR